MSLLDRFYPDGQGAVFTLDLVEVVTILAEDYCLQDERTGGIFLLEDEGELVLQSHVVNYDYLTADRAARCQRFAREKIAQLREHPEHVASIESRNEALEHWGGAIRIPDGYMSFSGLTEDSDEALCLRIATLFGLLALDEALRIAKISRNQQFSKDVAVHDRRRYMRDS